MRHKYNLGDKFLIDGRETEITCIKTVNFNEVTYILTDIYGEKLDCEVEFLDKLERLEEG